MYVSPQKASFKKSMRGYRARQVDAYIESLCTDFAGAEEDYQSRITSLEKEISNLKDQLQEYELLKQENETLKVELEQLCKRHFRITHKKNSAEEKVRTEENKQEKEEKIKHFFRVSADVVRFVGHTGQRISRAIYTLPVSRDEKKQTAPNTAKDAKKLAKTLAKKEKSQKRAQKKAAKYEKKRLKVLKKL